MHGSMSVKIVRACTLDLCEVAYEKNEYTGHPSIQQTSLKPTKTSNLQLYMYAGGPTLESAFANTALALYNYMTPLCELTCKEQHQRSVILSCVWLIPLPVQLNRSANPAYWIFNNFLEYALEMANDTLQLN